MLYHRICFLVIALLLYSDGAESLEIYELSVPSQVPLGKRATLTCRWLLSKDEQLYSVKWYKDDKEFFAHFPKGPVPRRSFPMPGVYVEMSDPTGSSLTLSPVELDTSGRYRCEISGERPQFLTVAYHADLQVVVLPVEGPTITGFSNYYNPDATLSVSCVAGKSRPATRLAWFVNEEPALPHSVGHSHELEHAGGLVSTSLDLEFRVKEEHFIMDTLKIKCLATIGAIYWRTVEQTAKKWKKISSNNTDLSPEASRRLVSDLSQPRALHHQENNGAAFEHKDKNIVQNEHNYILLDIDNQEADYTAVNGKMSMVLPIDGPTITGFLDSYSPGEVVKATCVSAKSRPGANLSWYVNDALSNATGQLKEYSYDDGMKINKLLLEFPVYDAHFGKNNTLKIKCTASINKTYVRYIEKTATKLIEELVEKKHSALFINVSTPFVIKSTTKTDFAADNTQSLGNGSFFNTDVTRIKQHVRRFEPTKQLKSTSSMVISKLLSEDAGTSHTADEVLIFVTVGISSWSLY